MRLEKTACLIALLLTACSEKGTEPETDGSVSQVLNVKPRERNDISWEPDAPLTMDIRWRFLNGEETTHGYEVKGAWQITLHNTSENRWRGKVWSLSFFDRQGFLISSFSSSHRIPLIDIRFEGNESFLRNGNFYLTLRSPETANEITKMVVIAFFEKL